MASKDPNSDGQQACQEPDFEQKRELFVRLLARHERRIYAYILSLVPSWHDADEISQETNVLLWKEFDRFNPETNFLAWALRVAHYQILAWRKRASRSKLVFSQELLELIAEEQRNTCLDPDAHHQALGACIEQLSTESRDLLSHCYVEGNKIKDVAERLNRTTAATYKALQRIRLALHKCIRKKLTMEGTA